MHKFRNLSYNFYILKVSTNNRIDQNTFHTYKRNWFIYIVWVYCSVSRLMYHRCIKMESPDLTGH